MNEILILLVTLAVGAALYSICAIVKHGNCNIGKLFTLLVLILGFVTGIFLFFRVVAIARANPSTAGKSWPNDIENSVWTAVAGIVLCISSAQEVYIKFKELFVKPVAPIKAE